MTVLSWARVTLHRALRQALGGTLAVGLAGASFSAQAQRAGENAVRSADDAFGTRVGNESIGLYDQNNARGFSPVQANNVRIEGLYFDQQAGLNGRVARGNTVRVGISAQSYAFPAPTGIADFSLRLPGDTRIVSAMAGGGAFDSYVFEIDAQVPLTSKLSVGFGGAVIRYDNADASKHFEWNAGLLFRARPNDAAEISGFWSQLEGCENKQQMLIFPAGTDLPPPIKRRVFYGQGWASGNCHDSNGGLLARFNLPGDWTIRAGAFRSEDIQHKSFADYMRDVGPDGTGQHFIVAQPRQAFRSYSGEIRANKLIVQGELRHSIDVALRARDVRRSFGGGDLRNLGPGVIGVQTRLPRPDFVFGPQTTDHTQQGTLGLSYEALWAGVGGATVGVQKVDYRRDTLQPNFPEVSSASQPWLYNAALNAFVTDSLALYASYTRGLEESGTAPLSAANRGEAMPVALTEQVDAGARYTLRPGLNMVAGVFQVEKPYFTHNAANVFGPSGRVRHRGVEVSLAGSLAEGLRVVGGLVALQARVTGEAVERGVIGKVPLGPRPLTGLLSLQYQPDAWNGFGVEGTVLHHAGQVARNDNLLRIDDFTEINLGVRYNFRVGDVPGSFRVRVFNAFNAYDWSVSSSGAFTTRQPRRILLNLAADF